MSCAWGGGPQGGQLALGLLYVRSLKDARTRQRHVLAASEGSMISGRGPAILQGDMGVGVGGMHVHGAYQAEIRVGASSIARSGADGASNFGWRSSFGKGWKARLGPAALLLLHSSRHASRRSQSLPPARVNRSTIPAPSTSCLVARAAGKPHCWPTVSKRDLGWALLRCLHWPSPSRASSRNRHAASQPLPPATGTGESMTWDFADGCTDAVSDTCITG